MSSHHRLPSTVLYRVRYLHFYLSARTPNRFRYKIFAQPGQSNVKYAAVLMIGSATEITYVSSTC